MPEMSNKSLVLASEHTDTLDFGEGTKIRVFNTTVTLKGVYSRADSDFIKCLIKDNQNYQAEREQVNNLCDMASLEKYPYDRERGIKVRVTNIVNRQKELLGTIGSLGDKISQRDTTIRELTQNVKFLKEQFRKSMIKVRGSILACALGCTDAELEKPNVC
jgi:hypothetical protein